MKLVYYFIALVLCGISIALIKDATAISIVAGIASSILFVILDGALVNIKDPKKFWISLRYPNIYIRLSVSYLFRIKIDGQYLLLRGNRFRNQFQPVGGVFKRLPNSSAFFNSIEALDDDLIPSDKTSKDDLRIRIKGKYLIKFLSWFNSGNDRELCPWREFYEELVEPGFLPGSVFPYIYYRHIRRYEAPLRYSEIAQSLELIIAEIYEVILTPEQEESLKQMLNKQNDAYIWVDEDRIRRRGAIQKNKLDINISTHSVWIL
jgi:hypothetical protein